MQQRRRSAPLGLETGVFSALPPPIRAAGRADQRRALDWLD